MPKPKFGDSRPATGTRTPISGRGASLHVSIVCAADGARFAAAASSERECLEQVARYVSEQAAGQLKPQSANRVRELLSAGDAAAAVAEYFRHTGERWEPEWLVTATLHANSDLTAWSGTVPLPEAVHGWVRARLAVAALPR